MQGGFQSKLGVLKGVKIKIDVPEDAKPKYFKPRSVPCALKDAIGCELDKRVRQGIFETSKSIQMSSTYSTSR